MPIGVAALLCSLRPVSLLTLQNTLLIVILQLAQSCVEQANQERAASTAALALCCIGQTAQSKGRQSLTLQLAYSSQHDQQHQAYYRCLRHTSFLAPSTTETCQMVLTCLRKKCSQGYLPAGADLNKGFF